MIWSLIDWSKLRPYFAKTLCFEASGWLVYLDAFINSAWDTDESLREKEESIYKVRKGFP